MLEQEALHDPAEGEGLLARHTLLAPFCKAQNRKEVPPGDCTKKLWQLALELCPELGKAITLFLNAMYAQGCVPKVRQLSRTVQFGKDNGKSGCVGT